MKVIVLGAGVIGAPTALALAERGFDVTLVDQADQPGSGTSFANGSSITPGHAEPWNPPGTVGRLAATLFDPQAPYRLYPRALPGLAGWGGQFLRNSRASRYYRHARHATRLAIYSKRCIVALRERYELSYDQLMEGSLELYFSARELDDAIELREKIGNPEVRLQQLSVAELLRREPSLQPVAGAIHGALWFPDHEAGDACLFSRQVAAQAERLGATLRYGITVQKVVCGNRSFSRLETDQGDLAADACVVAAGCESRALLAPLGLKLPIYPVKGYSATIALDDEDQAPRRPLLDLRRRFVTARLGRRLRIAGISDFAGYDLGIHPRRFRLLLASAAELLPNLREPILQAQASAWTGLRPMTPDGPPLLGTTPISGLYLNTGHGSMGWTQACGSAEVVADIITGKTPAIDTVGLLADRYLA